MLVSPTAEGSSESSRLQLIPRRPGSGPRVEGVPETRTSIDLGANRSGGDVQRPAPHTAPTLTRGRSWPDESGVVSLAIGSPCRTGLSEL